MWSVKKMFSVAALHIHEKKEKFFSLLFAVVLLHVSQKDRNKKKKRIDRCRSSFRLSRQDWSRLQRSTGWQNVVIVKDSLVRALLFHYGNFFHWFAPRSKSAFAPQVFLQEKHRERENNKSKEKRIYRKGDERRNNAKRETGTGGKAWCPYIVRYAWVGGEMIKKDVRSDGCSFSPRIVRRCRCAFHFSCTS